METKGELILKNGKISLPEKYELSESKRRLRIVMPWQTEIQKVGKGNIQVTTTTYFRQKGTQKPYIPEGYIQIDGDMFKVIKEVK